MRSKSRRTTKRRLTLRLRDISSTTTRRVCTRLLITEIRGPKLTEALPQTLLRELCVKTTCGEIFCMLALSSACSRSEERRVGKGWGSGLCVAGDYACMVVQDR